MESGDFTSPVSTPDVGVRDCAPTDYSACRMLWVELASWVAELDGRVVGLTGLLDRGTSGEVEPVIVTDRLRSRGVGRLLIERVVAEAAARGYEYLAIRPVARNVSAIRRFYDAGFQTLGGHVDLTMDLAGRPHRWLEGARLHGLDFRY
jgi:GNAT superfamily N-acetyltransferase